MIVYLATSGYRHTIRTYLESWGRPLARRIVPFTYDDALACRSLRAATYLFADLERLPPADAAAAGRLGATLAAHGLRTLNHPTRSLRRYDLLRTLVERGSNRFAAYRVAEAARARFPVFVRGENDHAGSRTCLLHDPQALAAAIAALQSAGLAREQLLVTEFCDTADSSGVYRKYSAFVIGDRIVPRHVFFSRHWMLKVPDLVDDHLIDEERMYVETNPHQGELRAIFRLAGLEWGRIDYSVRDGALQVWEINTNPEIMSFDDGGGPRRLPTHARTAVALRAAFAAIDHPGAPRPFRLPPGDVRVSAAAPATPAHVARAFLRRSGLVWHEERLRRWALPLIARVTGTPGGLARSGAPQHDATS